MPGKVIRRYPTGHVEILCPECKFEKGDIIRTNQNAYVVIHYYYSKEGIVYECWSEKGITKRKKG